MELWTYEEWRRQGRQVKRGEKAHTRGKFTGLALFRRDQTIPKIPKVSPAVRKSVADQILDDLANGTVTVKRDHKAYSPGVFADPSAARDYNAIMDRAAKAAAALTETPPHPAKPMISALQKVYPLPNAWGQSYHD